MIFLSPEVRLQAFARHRFTALHGLHSLPVALFTINNSIRTTTLPKHLEQIVRQLLWSLMRSKMSSTQWLTAMHKKQRYSIGHFTLLVNKANVQCIRAVHFDTGLEIGKLVDLLLLLPPIEFSIPVRRQALHVCKRGSVVPSCSIKLVWKLSNVQLRPQLVEPILRCVG